MFTPMINLPEDLISSGTVLAISSTAPDAAPDVGVSSPLSPLSVPAAQPDSARAPETANTAEAYHHRGRRRRFWLSACTFSPASTVPLLSASSPRLGTTDARLFPSRNRRRP